MNLLSRLIKYFVKNAKMTNNKERFRQCCVLYSKDKLIIACIHVTSSGMNPFGAPITILEKNSEEVTIGMRVLECLGESRYRNDENALDLETDNFYKLAGSKDLGVLTKKWKALFVHEENDAIVMRATFKDSCPGWAFDDKTYQCEKNASEIGIMLKKMVYGNPN